MQESHMKGFSNLAQRFGIPANRLRFLIARGDVALRPVDWTHPGGPLAKGNQPIYDLKEVDAAIAALKESQPEQFKKQKPGRMKLYPF